MINAEQPGEIAAVDLGSNSFRLQIARLVDGQILLQDSLRDMVRLGAGLDEHRHLAEETIRRAEGCLRRFAERLRGFDPHRVRVVATNTFRVAKNASELLERAQKALGFPIEIIAGREEARMIFVGVSHSLPASEHKRLVIDIGGGSTEFIVGQGFEPQQMESLFMGCVSYSMRYFADGKLSESNLQRAEIAARTEVQGIRAHFERSHWHEAVGSSGTARALGEIFRLNGWSDGNITAAGLAQLKASLIRAKEIRKIQLIGLSEERASVIAGGYSIMAAAFAELGIERMSIANGALREGVLYELLGRIRHHDTREATVRQFTRRYHVDVHQAKRVNVMALALFGQLEPKLHMGADIARQYLGWAARLHEVGVSIAHAGYHKHSAYIIENADMPGFSRLDQQWLGLLIRAQRRSLSKVGLMPKDADKLALILSLRLAVIFHRNRMENVQPQLKLTWHSDEYFALEVSQAWLAENPLTHAELVEESGYWRDIGVRFECS